MPLIHNLNTIAAQELALETENQNFLVFVRRYEDQQALDALVNKINATVAPQIDCLACGQCCKTLMVNITQDECERISTHLGTDVDAFKNEHVETSAEGTYMVMNTMPCTFLQSNNCCSIYQERFNECHEFPQLHNSDFKSRIFATMMHFGRCPIVYNVIQQVKTEIGFQQG